MIDDLKAAMDGLLTMWEGRWFHSGIVRGKKECLNMSVLVWYVWYFMLWLPLVVRIFVGVKYVSLFMSTKLFVILYNICCLCIFLRVARVSSFKCCLSKVTDVVCL